MIQKKKHSAQFEETIYVGETNTTILSKQTNN